MTDIDEKHTEEERLLIDSHACNAAISAVWNMVEEYKVEIIKIESPHKYIKQDRYVLFIAKKWTR